MNTSQIEWARTRIRSAAIVNGKYELDVQRETNMGNLLFIPGLTSPVAEIRQLLFGAGQPGGSWIPTLSAAMIAANSFGSGVADILDLSGNNNPFSQTTPASRGAWFREPKRGRVNLLEQTEDFGNAYWTKTRVTASGQIITETTDTGTHEIVRSLQSAGTIGIRYTMSCIISLTERTTVRMFFTGSAFGAQRGADFNLTTNEVTLFGVAGNLEASMAALADGKHFIRVSVDTGSTNTGVNPTIQFTDGVGVTSFAGSLTSSALIEKYQVELGSTPTAYQRVTTAFDVTEAGQRDCYGVRFDGVDDNAATQSIAWNSTEFTYWVALRKRTALGTPSSVLSLGADPINGNGTFELQAPGSVVQYQSSSRGTTRRIATTASFAAPDVAIICSEGSTALPILTLDRNGENLSTVTDSQGGGNYTSSPLYLGARAGTSLFTNCDVFAAIAVNARFSASIKSRISRILSRITPTVNL
jgi:hypothetical protein